MTHINKHTVPGLVIAFLLAATAMAQTPPAEIEKLLSGQNIFYDADGLIVHKGAGGTLDGGDTAQREGWYWLGVWIRQHTQGLQPWGPSRSLTFDQVLALLEPKHDGVFYRHPKQAPFNNPRDKKFGFSRDQMEPLVAAMGVWGKEAELRRLWDALPEDLLGKHSFNGNWRNFLGQDGPNCDDIRTRGCDATANCSLKVDTRDCSLQVDSRDCSLQVDNRDCSLKRDTRSCGHDIGPFHVNDPICEAAKAAQNKLYEGEKVACEAAKASQNAGYAAAKGACETAKATQNAAYSAQKAQCEGGKAAQNAAYAAEKAACETGKAAGKAACEAQKTADYQLCRNTNVHSGDLIGPMTINLFRRALGKNPLIPTADDLHMTIIHGGMEGEAELLINAHMRVRASQSKDDVGDDLNLIVKLLMAKLRHPTPISNEAVRVYAAQRNHSYGSYLRAYYAKYGGDMTDMENRLNAGIASGWPTDVKPQHGALRWYHRSGTGANPQLAELYSVILNHFVK